jgi:hypothetical protein
MNKKIYLYFAGSNTFESWQEINKIAIRHDTSTGMATCVYAKLELDDMAEVITWASELDKTFGLVFQKFIQAPKIDVSAHYEGNLELPMLIVENPQVIHKPTGEILELTKRQWAFIGECLEDRLGIEFLEVRDDLIAREEVLADIQRSSKFETAHHECVSHQGIQ